jgi:hypothetical protein
MRPPAAGSPTPREASDELRRVVERWHQLPLDRASARLPLVRALVQELADRSGEAHGRAPVPVPDLGPAVVMDQLAVMVHDVYASGAGGDALERLVALRHSL